MNILTECKELFLNARGRVVEAMPLLHKIATEKLWGAEYSSFGEYLDECGISRSQASRLVSTYQHYAIEGGIPVEQLNSVDPERLYLGIGLTGTAEQQLEKASVLNRQEIRESLSLKEDGSEHEHTPRLYCSTCWRPMDAQ